jgi:hypothetical protein
MSPIYSLVFLKAQICMHDLSTFSKTFKIALYAHFWLRFKDIKPSLLYYIHKIANIKSLKKNRAGLFQQDDILARSAWQHKCILKSGTAVWIQQSVSVGNVVMTTWARIQKSGYMRTVWKLPDPSQQMGSTMLECASCLCKPDKMGKRSTEHTFWSQQQSTQNGWSDIWFMLKSFYRLILH